MNIPQGYKQTELGIIPEDWEVVLLGSGLRFQTGYPFQSSYFNGDGIGVRLIRNRDLKSDDSITYYSGAIYNEFIVNNYDILIGMDGDFMPCVWDKGVALLNQRVGRLIVKNDWSPRYLYYALQEPLKQKEQGTGATTVKHLSHSDIERILMSIPPSKEQRAIAEALSDVDGLIAALDKKIAKKRLLKQGAMQQLLTGKKRLPGFTDEWVEKSFADIFIHISTRNHQIDSSLYQSVGKYPIVDQGQIPIVGYTDDVEPIVCEQDGTIIFGDHTRIFKYVNYNFCVGADGTQVLFCKNNMCTKFIYYLCCIMEIPNTGYNRHYKYVKDNAYTIPSNIKEQQAIVTILSDMDKEIADLEAQRDKYRLLKSGMMQKLLTGQIRLVKQQAKIVPLGVEVPVVREIPVATHIIAGHIVNRSHKSRGWGRTKLQKSLHLIGYCMQLNLGNEYIRNTAGPDDQQLMNYIDQKFRQYRHVNKVCEKLPDGKTHYSYAPTPMIQDVEMAYEKYPKELREQIDALIDKLNTMDLAGAEILSTLYAVWNNRIIKQEHITEDLLIADFYAWSTHKADFEEARVRKALNYI
ncbi:MAG: hypothetical protein E7136_03790 [Rikenellaceae bacterium]|nr:hypothetical protein [Rikenellaceae bacterium]